MNAIIKYLDKALEYETEGSPEKAVVLYDRLLEAFPDYAEIILTEKAKLEFRNFRDKEALLDFIRAYALSGKSEIYDLVLEAYLTPNLKMLQEQYQENLHSLKKYPFYMTDFEGEELSLFILWQDEEILCVVNTEEKNFGMIMRQRRMELEKKEILLMLVNYLWLEDIFYCEEQTRIESPIFDMDVPFYLVYDRNFWMLFTQMRDIQALLNKKRVVLLAGKESVKTYFKDAKVILPQIISVEGREPYRAILNEIHEERYREYKTLKKEAASYYKERTKEIIQNIRGGRPRILFWTSRFTSALQYHTRDCMQAAQRLGCETELMIEPDGIHRVTELSSMICISKFKPDVIFCLDHFRGLRNSVPDEVVWITWIQDKLSHSTGNAKILRNLGNRDILASMFISDLTGSQWGMEYKEVLKMPISTNLSLYHNWELTEEDKDYYGCDICIVANASDYVQEIRDLLTSIPEWAKKDCENIIKVYIDLMEQEIFFYGRKQNFDIIYHIAEGLGLSFSQRLLNYIAEYIFERIFYCRYKSLVAEWLIEHGYTNLRLYGNEWDRNEICRPYAMGVVENGQTLSKALAASKIAIGLHPHVSLPARLVESVSSGTFYLAHHIPEEMDLANAREYLKEDEEIVFYYHRQDLLQKVEYYLKQEEERKKIIEAGQRRIRQELSYEKILARILHESAELIEKREGGINVGN